jgi:hypothetical protein
MHSPSSDSRQMFWSWTRPGAPMYRCRNSIFAPTNAWRQRVTIFAVDVTDWIIYGGPDINVSSVHSTLELRYEVSSLTSSFFFEQHPGFFALFILWQHDHVPKFLLHSIEKHMQRSTQFCAWETKDSLEPPEMMSREPSCAGDWQF